VRESKENIIKFPKGEIEPIIFQYIHEYRSQFT